jgi:hypothetical protein
MARNTVIDGKTIIGPLRPHAIMDGFVLIEAFLPIGGICYDVAYLTRRTLRRDHFLQTVISELTENPLYRVVLSRPRHPFDYLACLFAYPIYLITSVNVGRT